MLIVGEIRTCLLHHSGRLPRPVVVELLGIKPGRRVLATNRPVNRSVSPDVLVCVDCRVPTEPMVKARGIGTVAAHAVVTGGLVLQSSARTRLERATARHRLTWTHYAARRGVVEVISKADVAQLAVGHRTGEPNAATLDLGAISEHLISVVQMRPQLNRRTAIRSRPTRVRWSAAISDRDEPAVQFHVDNEMLRTVELTVPADLLPFAERFCEDLALHDWLITVLDNVIEQAESGTTISPNSTNILSATVDRLVHLWMPGAHVHPAIRVLWDRFEARPGFSRQWNAQVAWVRDQIMLRTFDALEQVRHRDATW